jgi:hypothetical protein
LALEYGSHQWLVGVVYKSTGWVILKNRKLDFLFASSCNVVSGIYLLDARLHLLINRMKKGRANLTLPFV